MLVVTVILTAKVTLLGKKKTFEPKVVDIFNTLMATTNGCQESCDDIYGLLIERNEVRHK